jgi:PAS domain S-box-containing protein
MGSMATELDALRARIAELEAEQVRQQELLRVLIDHFPGLVNVKDQQSRYVLLNRHQAQLYGTTPAAGVGKTASELINPTYGAYTAARDQRIWTTGQTETAEETTPDAFGQLHTWRTTKAPLHDPTTGAIWGVANVSVDVTDMRQTETALAASEGRFHTLADHAPALMWQSDAAGMLVWCNRAWLEFTGRTHSATAGQPWTVALHPEDAATAQPVLARAHQQAFRHEYRIQRPDGSYRWLAEVVAPLVAPTGTVRGFIGFALDVDENKRAEAALRAAKDAAEAGSRAKSSFLATMSHEIRTPLSGIIGLTTRLQSTALAAEQREFLRLIRTSADMLMTIINDLLDTAKIEAGKLELVPSAFALRPILGELLDPLALAAHSKGVELVWQIAPDVPDGLVGDVGRMRQVLLNLLGNAIKFTRAGSVVLRVHAQSLAEQQVELTFSVRDTGSGIPADELEHIFEPFVQNGNSASLGTGLGLTISRRLAELMHGRVWAESVVGHGSTFHFTARLALGTDDRERGPIGRTPGLPVLVVEPHADVAAALEPWLRDAGLQPVVVTTGRAAFAALRQAPTWAGALVAAKLPDTTGLAFAAEIRRQVEWSNVPLILLTSTDRIGEADLFRRSGGAAVLNKPVRPTDLRLALRNVLTPAPTPRPLPAVASSAPSSPALRILLAEDNYINQQISVLMLKEFGHSVTLAENGHEVLAALERTAFDVILMDVQMPGMDGLEATARIRQQEQGTGRRLPIIALTAHAMKGDRERFLAAGMDGYVTKPIERTALTAALTECVPPARPPSSAALETVFDANDFALRLGHDTELMAEVLATFADHAPVLQADVARAVEQQNAPLLSQTAHTLKGTLANLSAPTAMACAAELEALATAPDWSAAQRGLAQLQQALTAFLTATARYRPS